MSLANPITQYPPDVARALRLWIALSRSTNAVERHARQDAARHDMTLAEFGVLDALFHKGPMLAGEVQRRLLVSSGGITYLVDRLVARGLVERRPCASDRRSSYVALTEQGTQFIRRVFPEHAAAITGVMAALTDEEQETLIDLLRRLGKSLRHDSTE